MLSAALRRNVGNRAFQNLQKRLLYALAAYVTRNRRVFGLSGDFINFIDINNAFFRTFHIIVRRLNEPQQNVFYIFADIARFRKRGRVCYGKRHVKHFGKCLCKHGFADARGA